MKNKIKIFAVILGAIAGAFLPAWGAFEFWQWCMSEVAEGSLRVLVTVLLILFGTSTVVTCSALLAAGFAFVVAALTD